MAEPPFCALLENRRDGCLTLGVNLAIDNIKLD